MGPFPHDAPPPAISDENPMGTDGFEFVEFCHPDPQILDRLFRHDGLFAGGEASLEERDALPPGRHQFHRQRAARLLCGAIRQPARPFRSRHGIPGRGCKARL